MGGGLKECSSSVPLAPVGDGSVPAPTKGPNCKVVASLYEGVLDVTIEGSLVVGTKGIVLRSRPMVDSVMSRVFVSP